MNEKTLAFLDVDGCLVQGRGYDYDLASIDKLRDVIKRNTISFVLSSGRSQPYLECLSQFLGLKTPYICENGSAIYDPASNGFIYRVETEDLHLLDDELCRLTGCAVVYEPGKEFSRSFRLKFDSHESSIETEFEYFNENVSLPKSLIATHSNSAIDVISSSVDKGTALGIYTEITHAQSQDTIAFGDSNNDIPMLILASIAGAPASATRQAKDHADYVSELPDIEGLLDFLKHLPES